MGKDIGDRLMPVAEKRAIKFFETFVDVSISKSNKIPIESFTPDRFEAYMIEKK